MGLGFLGFGFMGLGVMGLGFMGLGFISNKTGKENQYHVTFFCSLF